MTEVFLDDNNIGDAGISALIDACKNHPSVRSFHVARNRITAIGISTLASALPTLPFTHLYLAGNDGLKDPHARTELVISVIVRTANWLIDYRWLLF